MALKRSTKLGLATLLLIGGSVFGYKTLNRINSFRVKAGEHITPKVARVLEIKGQIPPMIDYGLLSANSKHPLVYEYRDLLSDSTTVENLLMYEANVREFNDTRHALPVGASGVMVLFGVAGLVSNFPYRKR